jgi:hypothetical protein
MELFWGPTLEPHKLPLECNYPEAVLDLMGRLDSLQSDKSMVALHELSNAAVRWVNFLLQQL